MFEKQRLSIDNIKEYSNQYIQYPKTVLGVPCLLQNDYGEVNDCTLTSITAIIKWLHPSENVEYIYNKVETAARKYGYKGNYGTPNFVIKSLYNYILRDFRINKKVHSRYFKDIGWGFNYIKKEIDEYQPVLLNLWKDGRNYYKNHSVLIIGYLETTDKKFLAIYDNWSKGISFIDYDKLSVISSICFLEEE